MTASGLFWEIALSGITAGACELKKRLIKRTANKRSLYVLKPCSPKGTVNKCFFKICVVLCLNQRLDYYSSFQFITNIKTFEAKFLLNHHFLADFAQKGLKPLTQNRTFDLTLNGKHRYRDTLT